MSKDFIIFDLETTGLEPNRHEIIEIGAVRVSADLANELGQFERKTLPLHIEAADPESLRVNGYAPDQWREAVALNDALGAFAEFSRDGVLAGYNVAFDWMFLKAACAQQAVDLKTDYHIFDVFSVAWLHSRTLGQPKSLRLTHLAQLYELPPQPEPHTALADARLTLELLGAVSRRLGLAN